MLLTRRIKAALLTTVVLVPVFLILDVVKRINETKDAARSSFKMPSDIYNTNEEELFSTLKGELPLSIIEKEVFNRYGYEVFDGKPLIPILRRQERESCEKVFSDYLKVNSVKQKSEPPREIPSELENFFTLFGYGESLQDYMDDRYGSQVISWTKPVVREYINRPVTRIDNYRGHGQCMYEVMTYELVARKKGFVVGAKSPWIEGIALQKNASRITTIESAKIISGEPRINHVYPSELARDFTRHINHYDFGASFSNFEHIGLGSFGDAIDPIGDLREMRKAKCLLKPGGYFFLSVPLGFDTIHWNRRRIYGRMRLALLFEGFELLGSCYKRMPFQLTKNSTSRPVGVNVFDDIHRDSLANYIQPVFVLRKL